MITGLREDFKTGQPASAVPVAWFNRIAHFLNNLVGGQGVIVTRDTEPPTIGLDIDVAKKALGIPERCPNAVTTTEQNPATDTADKVAALAPKAVERVATDANGAAATESDADKIARIGTSKFAARADHTHRDPVIHQSRQTCGEMIEARNNGNGSITLTFYPPVYDPGGRFIGLSTDGVCLGTFLEDVI